MLQLAEIHGEQINSNVEDLNTQTGKLLLLVVSTVPTNQVQKSAEFTGIEALQDEL